MFIKKQNSKGKWNFERTSYVRTERGSIAKTKTARVGQIANARKMNFGQTVFGQFLPNGIVDRSTADQGSSVEKCSN